MSDDKIQKRADRQDILRQLQDLDRQRKESVRTLEEVSGERVGISPYRGLVYLLIDCSTSMYGEKIEQAKRGSLGFAQDALKKGYSVGLIKFSYDSEHILEPSVDLGALSGSVERLLAEGSTNMAAAINDAIIRLRDGLGERVICVVTDGMPNDGQLTLNIAREAKSLSIDIMTIGTDDANLSFLEQLATRKELSVKVERLQLQQAITDMAKLLPGK